MIFSFVICFVVVLSSWPDKEQTRSATAKRQIPFAIGAPIVEGATVVPAAAETGSIHKARLHPQ
jgi:hypothetical protein